MRYTAEVEASVKKDQQELKILHPENVLRAAVDLYVQSHFDVLTPETPLQMVDLTYYLDLSSGILTKLLDQQCDGGVAMDLSKAELLVSVFVEKMYIGRIDQVDEGNDQFQVQEILTSLDNMCPLNVSCASLVSDVRTDMTDLRVILYENDRVEIDDTETNDSEVINDFDNIKLYSTSKNLNPINTKINLGKTIARSFTHDQEQFHNCITFNELPNSKFDDLWSSLKLDISFKNSVHNQVQSSFIRFNSNSSKLLLFHGPPGSGKSTFRKAISQKLAIKFQAHKQQRTLFLQVSCDKVFSKWYGESSKNLMNLFQTISRIVNENSSSMVVILIDEVESIASSREQALTKSETTDSIKTVNTMLTQMDLLRQHNNLLILATSNLLDSIDEAFIDRVDSCFFMNKPTADQIFEILLHETNSLIQNCHITSSIGNIEKQDLSHQQVVQVLEKLSIICYERLKISGRALSKLPHTTMAQMSNNTTSNITLTYYLVNLSNQVIQKSFEH